MTDKMTVLSIEAIVARRKLNVGGRKEKIL